MKKLESLKSSKFEAFKNMEVKNPLFIVGGLHRTTGGTVNGQPTSDNLDWNNDTADQTGLNHHVPGTPGSGYNGDLHISVPGGGDIFGTDYQVHGYQVANIHDTSPDLMP